MLRRKSGRQDEDPQQQAGVVSRDGEPVADGGCRGGAASRAQETEGDNPLVETHDAGVPGDRDEAVAPEEVGMEEAEPVDLARELEMAQDRYLRLAADLDNFKKRAAREKADLVQYGNEALLKALLPVIDDLERMLACCFQERSWADFRKGLELIVAEIRKALSRHGVEPLEALGMPFDPNLHEAMQRVETDRTAPNTVVGEFQKGYRLRDRLLRPSRVAVAFSESEATSPAGEPDADVEGAQAAGGNGSGSGAQEETKEG